MTTTTPLTKWAEKILTILAEQLAFRGHLPFLDGDRSTRTTTGNVEEIGKDDDDEVTKATLSFRLNLMDLERLCGYKHKTPFKNIIRSVVKTNLVCFNGRCVSLTPEGMMKICSFKIIRILKFNSNEDIRRYLLSHKISKGSQTILFNYLWDDGQYKTYQQLADHLSCETGKCYDPTKANFKSIIRELRRKADVVEHKLVGQNGTDTVRILRHFYHIGGPPSPTSSNSVDAISAVVKQEDCTSVKLEASQADRHAASNSNRTNSSPSSNTSTVKQEASTGTKKRTLTALEKQDEYRRKQQKQQQHVPSRKKPHSTEASLEDCQPVDQNLKTVGRKSSQKSSGGLEGHGYYLNHIRIRKPLNGNDKKMIDKFEQYLHEVLKDSETNRKNVIRQTIKMLSGDGVEYRLWKRPFLQGTKIDFLNSNFVNLKHQAKQWEKVYGEDVGHGWRARHPLGKLASFQEYSKANPDFLKKPPAPPSDRDNKPSDDLMLEKEKSTLQAASCFGGGGGGQLSLFLSRSQSASDKRNSIIAAVPSDDTKCSGGGSGGDVEKRPGRDGIDQRERFPLPQIKAEPDDTNSIPTVDKACNLFRSISMMTESTSTLSSMTSLSACDDEDQINSGVDNDQDDRSDDDISDFQKSTTTAQIQEKKDCDNTESAISSSWTSSSPLPSSSSMATAFEL